MAAETASDTLVLEAVDAYCEFSIHVSQHIDSNLSLKELDDALKRFYQMEVIYRK